MSCPPNPLTDKSRWTFPPDPYQRHLSNMELLAHLEDASLAITITWPALND